MRIANAIVPASMFVAAALFVLTPAELTQAQGPGARPDLDAIKRDYRRPAPRPIENQLLVDLGRALFFDPRISASGKTACASCHFPELGYVVTDAHPLVVAARSRYAPGARRYAGIVLDIVNDHCLALDWPRYSAESLADFARRAAAALAAEGEGFALAGKSAPSAWRFRRLLLSYAGAGGIDRAIGRTAAWMKKPEGLIEAGRDWREHLPQLRATLPQLLADLRAAALAFAKETAQRP